MNPIAPAVRGMSNAEIEADAEKYLRLHDPERLRVPGATDVRRFFDYILPDEYELETGVGELAEGLEGILRLDGVVLVNSDTYAGVLLQQGRPRFTMAHECYHGLKHFAQIARNVKTMGLARMIKSSATMKKYEDPEWQSDQFASAFLMPSKMVAEVTSGSGATSWANTLERVFRVSFTAAEVRLMKLKQRGLLK